MNKYKLSVITVNLNNGKGLLSTVQSISTQTFTDIEYIVIDGGSTDNSLEIIEKESCINHWVSEKDEGIYDAMNKGIRFASGEYILFLNSGDRLHENTTIEKVFPFLNDSEIIYGDLFFADKVKPYVYNYPDVLSFSFLFNASLAHPATFIKKDLFERFGLYDTTFRIVADWAFFTKVIAKENVATKHIEQIISDFDTEGISSKNENMSQIMEERERFLTKEFALFYQDYVNHVDVLNILQRIRSSKGYRLLRKLGVKKFQ